jgi:hypothetical protein
MYKVNSDNRPRRLVSYQGLPKKWQEEFDYISHDCSFDLRFVMYKTEYYDTIDTQRIVIGAYKLGWGHGRDSRPSICQVAQVHQRLIFLRDVVPV